MSDPRFARLKTDPRFRKPRRQTNKVVVDERFKSIFDDGAKSSKSGGRSAKVDKYGKKVSATHDSDNLRRFYRLEDDEEDVPDEKAAPDYARGEVLMESSDEEEEEHESESDGGEVVLGRNIRQPITVPKDDVEIDLDESQFAELDAQAAASLLEQDDASVTKDEGERTNRLAVVNLDWDHVRASHLFKIVSSVISPSIVPRERGSTSVTKGKVLHVRIYPSEFGKKRLAQEEKEGPPKELFKNRDLDDDREGDEVPLVEEDDGHEYDEEALRKYQLERLRYYYGIITCDTDDAAAHIYSELDGTELERSANMFDLSFVPNDMTFDDDFRDEATQELSRTYKGVEFVTDALRHSRVKLTWDDDDPERNKITRRNLSQKEIEESDFRAYLASSGSEDDGSDNEVPVANKRNKMRELLLGGNDGDNELLPEGWGQDVDKAGEMEITFTPGLSGSQDVSPGDETTLQQYLRKQKEKRKKKKTDKVEKKVEGEDVAAAEGDDFFGEDSDQEEEDAVQTKSNRRKDGKGKPPPPERIESSTAELELILASDKPANIPKHFDMRSVLKAEKAGKKSRKRNKKNKMGGLDEDEAQEDFTIDVKDDRFKVLHDDPTFAIDPTNPHFKKTKSMAALLEERANRHRDGTKPEEPHSVSSKETGERSLKSLVESVKRKSALGADREGKRRKL